METIKTCVLALVAILSVVAAAENQLETSETLLTSRSLLGEGKCTTRKYAQCGGKGNGGRKDGVWRCCPKGYYCKKYNFWWHSCQKKKKSSPKPNRSPTPASPTSTNPTNSNKNSNKMLKDGGAYNPDEFDPCAKILPQMKENSHWCKFPKVKKNPSRAGLKVDRQSMYNGPIGHLGYCNKQLEGQAEIAGLAVSTKYLAKNGWAFGTDPYCGKCACLRVTGNDYWVNPTPNPPEWVNSVGTIIKGQVIDMCPECCDDHIDILLDRGYSTAPVQGTNPKASEVNALPGLRPIPLNIASAVGVWTIEWDWLDDCSQSCDANFFKP